MLESAYSRELQKNLKAPIVVSSLNSLLFRPYSLSDMLQFSDLTTLIDFWSLLPDTRESLKDLPKISTSFYQWSKSRLAEVYLMSHYLESQGEILDFTLKHYHFCLTRYFAIVDADALGHYWAKYSLRSRSGKKLIFPYPQYEISAHDYWELQNGIVSYENCQNLIEKEWN
jgi:hypothetical protein